MPLFLFFLQQMFVQRDNRLRHSKTDCLDIGLPFLNVFSVLTILRQELLQYTSTVVAALPVCACSWDSLHSVKGEEKDDINYLTTTEVSLLIHIPIAYMHFSGPSRNEDIDYRVCQSQCS